MGLIALSPFMYLRSLPAEPLDTYHSRWHLVRDTADEDAADFATALDLEGGKGDFANKPSGAFHIPPFGSSRGNEGSSAGAAWRLAFSGSTTDGDDDSETFGFTVVGWARINGMAQVICDGTGKIGLQDVVLYPHDNSSATNRWWADTLVLGTSKWRSAVVYNSGNDQVCIIHIDVAGLEWLQVFIYDANGTGSEAGDITVIGRRY